MKTFIVCLITSLVFTGCAIIPKSSAGLVESSKTTETFCYNLPSDVVETRVREYLSECYHPVEVLIPVGGFLVPMDADFQVIQEELLNGKRYSVRNSIGFGYSANVIPNLGNCETQVDMFGVSSFWQRVFTRVDEKIKGQHPKCPL